jgi:DNA-binding MarR family transcriptional regulator
VNTLHDWPREDSQGSAADALERLFELTVLLGEAMEQDLRRRNLTRPRAALLWVLHHRGPLKQAELAQALRVTPRNVTGLLDGLQAAGLVARSPHPTDRRATLVTLTGIGAAAAKALHTDQLKLADYLFTGLSPAELGGFILTLEGLLASLHSPAFSEVRNAALRRWPPRAARRKRVRKSSSG